jgi:Tfp pilus assembly protein PilW
VRHNRELGITVVEVIISLLLATVVVAGAYAILNLQQRVFRQQVAVESSQEGMWASMELMARDVRKAGNGFGACPYVEGTENIVNRSVLVAWSAADTSFNSTNFVRAIEVRDNTEIVASPYDTSDQIAITYANPASDGVGQPIDTVTEVTSALPATLNFTFSLPGPSPAAISEYLTPYFATCTPGTAGYTCTSALSATLKPLAMVSNSYMWTGTVHPCTLVQITSAVQSAGLANSVKVEVDATHAWWNRSSGTIPTASVPVYKDHWSGATLTLLAADPTTDFVRVMYYLKGTNLIRDTAYARCSANAGCPTVAGVSAGTCQLTDTKHITYQWCSNPQTMATNIEDLQIAVACDWRSPTTTGAPDGFISPEGTPDLLHDEWFYNVAGEPIAPTGGTPAAGSRADLGCNTFRMVRLSMTARTATPDPSFTGPGRPALENHAASTVGDSYRRRTLSTVVTPPNLNLLH